MITIRNLAHTDADNTVLIAQYSGYRLLRNCWMRYRVKKSSFCVRKPSQKAIRKPNQKPHCIFLYEIAQNFHQDNLNRIQNRRASEGGGTIESVLSAQIDLAAERA